MKDGDCMKQRTPIMQVGFEADISTKLFTQYIQTKGAKMF